MDSSVSYIADYAHALRFGDLTETVVHQCIRCTVDTFGVALGAYDIEASRIARDLALRVTLTQGARIIGSSHRTLPELAAFANGVMIRYLDGNDGFTTGGGGHPSDAIAAILAAADLRGSDGKMIILAIALAYEVHHNLWKAAKLRRTGLDTPLYTAVASAVAAAKILGLDRAKIAEAISLAIVPNLPLAATRFGALGMWKGCAGGNAARNGLFAVLLAERGLSGPDKPIEGSHGLENLVGKVELPVFGDADHPFSITEVTLKNYLACGATHSAITVALELSQQLSAEAIEKVVVFTYASALEFVGNEPEKWTPANRDAADHSLPYIVAAVLVDRNFSEDIYSDERLRDPRIRRLITKIEVKEDPQFTPQFPQRMPCRIEIHTNDGQTKMASTSYPRGHFQNPMTDSEIEAKFQQLVQRVLPPERADRALATIWRLDTAVNLDEIFDALKIYQP